MKTKNQELINDINDLASLRELLSTMKKAEARLRKRIMKSFKGAECFIAGHGVVIMKKEHTRRVLDPLAVMAALQAESLDKYCVTKKHHTLIIIESEEASELTENLIELYENVA